MSIYYQDDLVTLYHGDCREVLANMADQSVDAVITDPPYSGRTHAMARSGSLHAPAGGRALSGSKRKFAELDDATVPLLFAEFGRVSRRWVVSNLDYRHAFQMEVDPPQGLRILRIGAWVKTNPMPIFSADRPAQGWEAILYSHRDDVKPTWHGGGKHGNYILPIEGGQGHPTSKPLVMVQDFVRRFTNHGDLILDPFAGSGTTLRAAVNEGRKAIGVERDERYCELIANRMGQCALDFGSTA